MDLFMVEAAGGLVEQQDFRIGGQCPCELDTLLGAERQAGNGGVRDVFEVKIGEDLVDLGVDRGLGAADPAEFQRVADDIAGGAGVGADAHIVEHREIGKQRYVLEGAADADLGDPVRRPPEDAPAFHQDVAGARLIKPAQAVEQRGLAGAVRSDQAEDLALMHVEGDAVQRDDAAEHDADVADRQQGILSLRELCPRHMVPPSARVGPDEPTGTLRRSRR
jgi:hypothetical protein